MRYRIHVQHGRNGEPLIEADTEEQVLAELRKPGAQWAHDNVTGEALALVDGALVRHATDMSREKFAQQDAGPTVQ